jgi:N-acetylmuramoyl-L-alanine amidase
VTTDPLIRPGDLSEQVEDVQTRLRALGIGVDDEPGHFAESTERAVRIFQQSRGVLVDGIVGPHTWNELVDAGWRLGDRILYLKLPPMRGDDVQVLQSRLIALGFDAGHEDGIFGRDTDRAVRAFQREYDIPEDGIWGARSHAALQGLRIDRPATASGLREELHISERGRPASVLIAIDPGHGGSDEGDRGLGGITERDLCWDLATRLAQHLRKMGTVVALTRDHDEAPDVTERVRRANDIGGDVLLSLHFNSHSHDSASGASTYYFPTSRAGELLAERIQSHLTGLGLSDCRSHPRSYPILKGTRMPAVLIEPAFITNVEDLQRLKDADFRELIADGIATAVGAYFYVGS